MRELVLSERLEVAAGYVRDGAVFADVGTDHAYLPIALISRGRVCRAYGTDIHAGPLSRARENVAAHGLSDRISLRQADGLTGLGGTGITDVAICGMGGEMILSVIENAPFFHTRGVRFILQPMTRQSVLREGLWRLGFHIAEERYASDGGRDYVTMLCEYTGVTETHDALDAEFGVGFFDAPRAPAANGYLNRRLRALTRTVQGQRQGGEAEEGDQPVGHKEGGGTHVVDDDASHGDGAVVPDRAAGLHGGEHKTQQPLPQGGGGGAGGEEDQHQQEKDHGGAEHLGGKAIAPSAFQLVQPMLAVILHARSLSRPSRRRRRVSSLPRM